MRSPTPIAVLSLVVLGALVWSLGRGGRAGPAVSEHPLRLYCAAGIRPPVEELVHDYRDRYGVVVEIQYGGSGTLLANLEAARTGDLYIAGDDSFIERAQGKGLVAEALPLAVMRPVIGVARGNPHRIESLEDLTREDLAVGLANPDAAAVGKISAQVLEGAGLRANVKVEKPTVTELANDLVLGTLDAAVIWDATARQYDEIDFVRTTRLDGHPREVSLGVLTSSEVPTAALQLARFLASRDIGAPVFERHGYERVHGDVWAEVPTLDVMCGAMLNAAVDETIAAFAEREGVDVRCTYNGCGMLVAQMKAGAEPDAYFSCDVSFLDQVRPAFGPDTVVSRNPMVILVAKGNPERIESLADLARPGLVVGLADEEDSALGALTRELLRHEGVEDALLASGNLKVETPTGDLLVNQLRVGSLDATVVYTSNAARAEDEVERIAIPLEGALAAQPWAVASSSTHPQLAGRLFDALTGARSRARFEELGFLWEIDEQQ